MLISWYKWYNILYSSKLEKYYIGYTNDINRRLEEHNRKKGKFTDTGIPWLMVYSVSFDNAEEAHKRELEIKKKKSKKYIEWLISQC